MYRFEMHLHSCRCSRCAGSDSLDYVVKAAKELAYSGIVFTNHFYHGNSAVSRDLPWRDFVYAYRDDYLRAKELGDKIGLTVLFGLEEGIAGSHGKEVLIYGLEAETIASCEAFRDMDLAQMSSFVRENNGFFVCAHPFRERDYILNPRQQPDSKYFDALEVYNSGNEAEFDRAACEYAKQVGLPGICGGDTHHEDSFGSSAMDFDEPVRNNADLVRQLKAGSYQMILRGEKVFL